MFKEKLGQSTDYSQQASQSQFQIARAVYDRGIIDSIMLIALAYGMYFFLVKVLTINTADSGFIVTNLGNLWNYIIIDVILGSYFPLLNRMVYKAIFVTLLPASIYILCRFIAIKFPKINNIFPYLAYIAVVLLAFNVVDNNLALNFNFTQSSEPVFPSVWQLTKVKDYLSEVMSGYTNWFKAVWESIVTWLNALLTKATMAVVFGSWFHSRDLGKKIALSILFIVNIIIFSFFGIMDAIIGAIPIVSGPGGVAISGLQCCFNLVVISDLFIILAVSGIGKYLVDFFFEKILGQS
jgi:hypothetical protein